MTVVVGIILNHLVAVSGHHVLAQAWITYLPVSLVVPTGTKQSFQSDIINTEH